MKIRNAVLVAVLALGVGVGTNANAAPLYAYQYSIGQGVLGGHSYSAAADPNGNVFVADVPNNRIATFSSNGTFLSAFGTAGTGDGQFSWAYGVTADKFGNVFVADAGNGRIQKFSNSGSFMSSFGSDHLSGPNLLTTDQNGNVWVADVGTNRVVEFSNSGAYISSIGNPGPGWNGAGLADGQLHGPYGVALDSEGDIWVADLFNNRIQEFASDGTFLKAIGTLGAGHGQFNNPIAIAVDSFDRILVADNNNNRVEIFSNDGVYLDSFVKTNPWASPIGLSIDAAGKVYVGGGSSIEVFVPTAPIPEPETYAMMLAGLGLLGVMARRRKQSQY